MTALPGKTIVCTGEVAADELLVELLAGHGANAVHYPCIAIGPPNDTVALDSALASASRGEFTWIAFTSTNAVEQVANRLGATGITHLNARIATIGPITAANLPSTVSGSGAGSEGSRCGSPATPLGLMCEGSLVDFIPSTFTAAALAAELPISPGDTVLIPQADIAAPTLADDLRSRGAEVTTVTAYRTLTGSGGVNLPTLLIQGRVDAVLFASPSAISGCRERFTREGGDFALLSTVLVVCIGPVTAAAARDYGLTNLVTATEHTRSGMARTLIAEFSAHREETHA